MKTVTGGTCPHTSTMPINDGEPCVQRDCAAETVCCDRANLRAMLAEGSMLAHVMGHNFAPFAFQKPRLGLLTEQTALYTFTWVSARSRPRLDGTNASRRRILLVFVCSSAATRRLTAQLTGGLRTGGRTTRSPLHGCLPPLQGGGSQGPGWGRTPPQHTVLRWNRVSTKVFNSGSRR